MLFCVALFISQVYRPRTLLQKHHSLLDYRHSCRFNLCFNEWLRLSTEYTLNAIGRELTRSYLAHIVRSFSRIENTEVKIIDHTLLELYFVKKLMHAPYQMTTSDLKQLLLSHYDAPELKPSVRRLTS